MEPKTPVKGLDEMKLFVHNLLLSLSDKNRTAVVIALSGNLGAGKTTLVQQLAKELGVTEMVSSPTFTIMKTYVVPNQNQFKKLIHMDAYRIESLDEIRPLGLEELLLGEGNLVCIEWAERIAPILPKDTIYLTLTTVDEDTREITFSSELLV